MGAVSEKRTHFKSHTLHGSNIAPENGWLEDEFPFGMANFQGFCIFFFAKKMYRCFWAKQKPVINRVKQLLEEGRNNPGETYLFFGHF